MFECKQKYSFYVRFALVLPPNGKLFDSSSIRHITIFHSTDFMDKGNAFDEFLYIFI